MIYFDINQTTILNNTNNKRHMDQILFCFDIFMFDDVECILWALIHGYWFGLQKKKDENKSKIHRSYILNHNHIFSGTSRKELLTRKVHGKDANKTNKITYDSKLCQHSIANNKVENYADWIYVI